MSDNIVKKILQFIEKLVQLTRENDPTWDARVLVGYRAFRAFDQYRFRLEPADLKGVLKQLEDCVELLERIIASNIGQNKQINPVDELQDGDARMQYLYGLAWAQQSDQEYYHGASHFTDRLVNSNLDISFLKNAECLDLGTGHARYALAMVQLGAKSVTGIDFSSYCLDEAKRRLKLYPKETSKIKLIFKSVYELPKSMNKSFDFVCANGFIHHLPDPVGGWQVMHDCLKKDGHAFTFVFTEDGTPWWRVVDLMRELLKPVPIWYSHKMLEFYEVKGNKIFNFLDYSYTPIQHRFKRDWVEDTLRKIGFKEMHFLNGGVIHDSVLRSRLFDSDRQLYGDSEIRYLLKK